MKHTRCMFHFCFQCFILQTLTIKNETWCKRFHFLVQEIQKYSARDFKPQCKRFQTSVQEIQNEGMKSNLKHVTLNFIRQTI